MSSTSAQATKRHYINYKKERLIRHFTNETNFQKALTAATNNGTIIDWYYDEQNHCYRITTWRQH